MEKALNNYEGMGNSTHKLYVNNPRRVNKIPVMHMVRKTDNQKYRTSDWQFLFRLSLSSSMFTTRYVVDEVITQLPTCYTGRKGVPFSWLDIRSIDCTVHLVYRVYQILSDRI